MQLTQNSFHHVIPICITVIFPSSSPKLKIDCRQVLFNFVSEVVPRIPGYHDRVLVSVFALLPLPFQFVVMTWMSWSLKNHLISPLPSGPSVPRLMVVGAALNPVSLLILVFSIE